jgi:hypothetical protein
VIRKFSDKAKSMDFINEVRRHEADFITTETSFDLYTITQNNYKELLKSKDANLYKIFYNKYYLQN